ncbi:MAG: hypothetical protein HQ518_31530 [Rhodopirellula sp.]|nr:hypothetical protein [Rhodopirellula sp.]
MASLPNLRPDCQQAAATISALKIAGKSRESVASGTLLTNRGVTGETDVTRSRRDI